MRNDIVPRQVVSGSQAAKRKMSENANELKIIVFMRGLGWREYRNHVGVFFTQGGARITIGTPGTPDWTFRRQTTRRGYVQVCHVEVKAEGVTLSPDSEKLDAKHQIEEIAKLDRYYGEPACWCNSLEMFRAWYAAQLFDAPSQVAA